MGQHGAEGICCTLLQIVWDILQTLNKNYPDIQFSTFFSSDSATGCSLELRVIELDEWQSRAESTAAVENENQYFCRGGWFPDGKRSERGHLMTITHINSQTLPQDTWSSEMLCLQDPALYGIRTAKKQQTEQHETISARKWTPSCFVLVVAFASAPHCKKADTNSYIARYSQQSILCGLSPNSWGRINLKGAFLLSWLANSWFDKKPVVVLKAHKSIAEAP